MDWGKVPPAEMKQRQVRKLREFLSRKVYPYCPYYRRLFDQHKLKPEKLRQLEDLSHIPFTTKADIAPTADDPARFREFIIQPTPEQLKANLTLGDKLALFLKSRSARRSIPDLMLDEYLPLMPTFTTGRTSLPTAFVYTRADIDILSVAGSRMFKSIGLVRKDDRGLNVFPFVPHLAFWQVAFAGFEYGLFLLHSGGGKAMGTPKILDIAARSKPTFLVGTPGYVMHLAHVAEEQGVEISSLRRVILGAERASPEYKAKLRNQLARIGSPDVQIFVTYGFTEAKKAWTENADDPGSRFLTYPDMEIIEVIDPDTGEAVPEGHAGEIVYTHIGGAGTTVLRYRTGDRVAEGLAWGECPHTGLVLPLLGTTISRVSEIKKVKETLVDFNELFAFFSGREEIVDWQIVIEKPEGQEFGMDVVRLNVALSEGSDPAAFDSKMQQDFKVLTEIGLDSIRHFTRGELAAELGLDTLPKETRIVDKRPGT